jgi:hypothetical protein
MLWWRIRDLKHPPEVSEIGESRPGRGGGHRGAVRSTSSRSPYWVDGGMLLEVGAQDEESTTGPTEWARREVSSMILPPPLFKYTKRVHAE